MPDSTCCLCDGAPRLLILFEGKPYCIECLLTEYPITAIDLHQFLADHIHHVTSKPDNQLITPR